MYICNNDDDNDPKSNSFFVYGWNQVDYKKITDLLVQILFLGCLQLFSFPKNYYMQSTWLNQTTQHVQISFFCTFYELKRKVIKISIYT